MEGDALDKEVWEFLRSDVANQLVRKLRSDREKLRQQLAEAHRRIGELTMNHQEK